MRKCLNRGERIRNRKERTMNYLLSSRRIETKTERKSKKIAYYQRCRSAPRRLTPKSEAGTSQPFKHLLRYTVPKMGKRASGDGGDFRDVDI